MFVIPSEIKEPLTALIGAVVGYLIRHFLGSKNSGNDSK